MWRSSVVVSFFATQASVGVAARKTQLVLVTGNVIGREALCASLGACGFLCLMIVVVLVSVTLSDAGETVSDSAITGGASFVE